MFSVPLDNIYWSQMWGELRDRVFCSINELPKCSQSEKNAHFIKTLKEETTCFHVQKRLNDLNQIYATNPLVANFITWALASLFYLVL